MRRLNLGCVVMVCALGAAGTAHAQCRTIDFEDFAVGDPITTLPGITVLAVPGSCGGDVRPVVGQPAVGTSSGTRALTLAQGCLEFNPDFLRLLFDEDQAVVSFTVGSMSGVAGAGLEVRSYTRAGALIETINLFTGGDVRTLVRFGSEGGPNLIARVDIEFDIDLYEAIDDLSYAYDGTPPQVEIDEPAFGTCVCSGFVNVAGSVGDDDGTYGCDRFEYRPVNAGPEQPWVLLAGFCGEFSGTLYTWITTSVPHGHYYLRVTGANECGLESSDVTLVVVDKQFGTARLLGPDGGETVCGVVDITGEVFDGCPETWVVEYEPAGGGGFVEIASGSGPVRGGSCTVAAWDTTAGGIADGDYVIRLTGTDSCGNFESDEVMVTVDNSAGCDECGPDINGDGFVNVQDLLILLGNWSV